MTLAIARRFLFDPLREENGQAIFMATDSRVRYPDQTLTNDGSKLIRLGDRAAGAYAGRVPEGEASLALAHKLIGKENHPTIQVIAERTMRSCQKL